ESETRDHGIEIALLVLERVVVPLGLVRVAPAEEVEDHDVAAAQVRDDPVLQMMVVGIAVHEDDGRARPALFTRMDPVGPPLDPAVAEVVSRPSFVGAGGGGETGGCPPGREPEDGGGGGQEG